MRNIKKAINKKKAGSNVGNISETVGMNAGKVWHVLAENNRLTNREIESKTKIKNEQLYAVIGWLARENRIYKDGDHYMLGETNLTPEIGTNAGKVWTAMNEHAVLAVEGMAEHTHLAVPDIYSALGWLVREDKIETAGKKYCLKK